MIKLILSDVDGTLLDHGEDRLPEQVFEVIGQLCRNDIVFAAASGRDYGDLSVLFAPVRDKIAFVCSDGAMTVYQGEVLNVSYMERDSAIRLIWDIKNRSGCEYLVYGRKGIYASPKTMRYKDFLMQRYGAQCSMVQSPSEVEDDFLKVAVYADGGVEPHSEYFAEKWGGQFDVVYNANVWMEFVAPKVSKVTGVKTLCRHFGFDIGEVAAFGDGGNDVKLLEAVGRGYAMDYAAEQVKQAADFVTADVMETIKNDIL